MADYTLLINAFIALIGVLITSVLIPLIRSKTTAEQQQMLSMLVSTAVRAAEQIYKGTGLGKEKKEYVLYVLEKNGIKINVENIKTEINILIEAAVLELQKIGEKNVD